MTSLIDKTKIEGVLNQYLKKGDYDSAIKILEGLYANNTKNISIIDSLIQVLLKKKDMLSVEKWAKKGLELDNKHPKMLSYMGYIHQRKGQTKKALDCYHSSVKSSPNDVGMMLNLAGLYKQEEQYDDALDVYMKALSVDADDAIILFNIASTYSAMKNFSEAEGYFKRAIIANPHFYGSFVNYGNMLFKCGRLQEAFSSYLKVFDGDNIPESFLPYYGFMTAAIYAGEHSHMERVLAIAVTADLEPHELFVLYSYMSISHYVQGEFESAVGVLEKAKNIRETKNIDNELPNYLGILNYYNYLSLLCEYHKNSNVSFKREFKKSLYLVGDSHCLSPSYLSISDFTCVPKLVIGAKLWHIAQKEQNKFKNALSIELESIPHGSKVVLMFGEIDCRPDEGIYQYYLKNPHVDLAEHIKTSVESYIAHILAVTKGKDYDIYVYGVAFNIRRKLNKNVSDALKNIVEIMNKELEGSSKLHHMKFVDIYDFLGGLANEAFIDDMHLSPHIACEVIGEEVRR